MIRSIAATLAAFLLAGPAAGEPACGPLDVALDVFRVQNGEVPLITMRDAAGRRLMILANPETGAWSMLVLATTPENIACLVATGRDIAPMQRPSERTS